ncbi:methylated-DNA--[protein]-cysteine S-methyltransferase [Methanobacterium oryzae]|uniref:methylated-DNA--[protein]-cysteine S-methyltransferase n=1 Tax=Methanobacterium oryzae TaxID=69540 RepID=UPI003D249781
MTYFIYIYGGIQISNEPIISTYNKGNLHFAVAVKDKKIIKTILPKSSKKKAINDISDEYLSFKISNKYQNFAEDVCNAYFGNSISFKDKFDYSSVNNEFQKEVLQEVAEIPYGETKTYKQIAEAIDSKAYRAVGTAIGKNPLPIIIPCHRVIKSDLSIGGFFGGTEMKKEILENEGVCIVNGKIQR